MMYKMTLQVGVLVEGSSLLFRKRIELPFPPYEGLAIKVSNDQKVKLVNLEWDLEKSEFTSTNQILPFPEAPTKSKETIVSDFMGWGWTL